jgi:shikimate kinase
MTFPLAQRGLVLIGMAGAGKTTVGQLLASRWGVPFIDTDHLLEQVNGEPLQSQLDRLGYAAMRQAEDDFVATCDLPSGAVVATGGSVIYGQRAMERLRRYGYCIYLQISLATVMQRVDNWQSRGFSCAPGQTFEEVYQERMPLYQHYADLLLPCDDLSPEQVVRQLEERLMPSRVP